jgi:hypothetical protein
MSQTDTLPPHMGLNTKTVHCSTYAHTKPYSVWIFKVSHHFRLAQQQLAFRFSGMWHCITRLSVSQHFTVTQCLHLQTPFWWHSNTYQKIRNLSHHCNKQTNIKHDLQVTHVWYPVTNKMSRRQWNNKHHYLLGAAHIHSLKDKRAALRSIQNDGNAYHIYKPIHCRYFLAHWLTTTCWNEQIQQSICQRTTMYTTVYHWLYWLQ